MAALMQINLIDHGFVRLSRQMYHEMQQRWLAGHTATCAGILARNGLEAAKRGPQARVVMTCRPTRW